MGFELRSQVIPFVFSATSFEILIDLLGIAQWFAHLSPLEVFH
jgi:hypothetical protein